MVGLNDSGSSAGVFYAGSVQNCYYLSTGNLAGISVNNGTEDSVATEKGAEKFASGEVAYLLNGDQSNIVWYQTLGANGDSLPVLTAKDNNSNTVYKSIYGDYTNDAHETHTAVYNNGFCANCTDGYEPAELVNGVYQIGNAGQLYWFMEHDNAGNTTANAILTANIVINENVLTEDGALNGDGSNFRAWTPIGNRNNPYIGTFDGNGYTVSGLYFRSVGTKGYCVGLIGSVGSGATVRNVGVVDSYIKANSYVGGVVGENYGTVENCYNAGCTVDGASCVGGVVGVNNGTVQNCYNTGNVSGSDYVGGVVGTNYTTVQNCYNTGSVSGSYDVGGVVGTNYITVQNCYNAGNVSGSNANYVGGVIGRNYKTVENCYSTGSISANGTDVKIGGVAGDDQGGAHNCYYLSDSETDSFGGTTAKTAAQFANGEVAFLLGEAFGQKLGENGDPYPVFATESNKVYAYLHCDGKTAKYTNDASLEGKTMSHTPVADDGDCTTDIPCTVCGQVATKGAETHTPGEDDGDCTTDIPCTVCGQAAIKGVETHTPAEDDGDCTTAVICTECGGIAIEAEHDHTLETVDQTMYCIHCDVTSELVEIEFDMVESVMDAAKSVASDVLGSVVGMVGEAVSSVVDMVYDSFSRFFSNMLSGY